MELVEDDIEALRESARRTRRSLAAAGLLGPLRFLGERPLAVDHSAPRFLYICPNRNGPVPQLSDQAPLENNGDCQQEAESPDT
jgi:hypothetical protein